MTPAGTPATAASKQSAEDASAAAKYFVEQQLKGAAVAGIPCAAREKITCERGVDIVHSVTTETILVASDTAKVVARYLVVGSVTQAGAVLRYAAVATTDTAARRHFARPMLVRADTLTLVKTATEWQVRRSGAPRAALVAEVAAYYFELPHDERVQMWDDSGADGSYYPPPELTRPSDLTQLPAEIRDTLEGRRCRVLQKHGERQENVVKGEFIGTSEEGWAMLCVIDGEGAVFVFRRAGGAPVATLSVMGTHIPNFDKIRKLDRPPDPHYLCTGGIHHLSADVMSAVLKNAEPSDDDPLSPEERATPPHDGFLDGDCDGVSVVRYWTGKRWVVFPGGH